MKKSINIAVVGTDQLVYEWLRQFPAIKSSYSNLVLMKLVTVIGPAGYLFCKQGLSAIQISQFDRLAQSGRVTKSIEMLIEEFDEHLLVIDLTQDKQVANAYFNFAELGWDVIATNRLPLTFARERHQALSRQLKNNRCYWGCNATVGAALPIQSSILELVQSGDQLYEINGVFSSGIVNLLNEYDGKNSFADLLISLSDSTDYNIWRELSGEDAAQKLLLLARLAGFKLDFDDISILPLLPIDILPKDVKSTVNNKNNIDEYMAAQYCLAQELDKTLVYKAGARFVGHVIEGSVKLDFESSTSSLVRLNNKDNVFELKSDFYADNPLVIKGCASGAKITTAAVNKDLNTYVNHLLT